MKRILECVPNYSEGRDPAVIDAIVGAIGSVPGVQVLHVDGGAAANRTVVTFAGAPEAVVEAAFRGSKAAQERIDMRVHHGEHPRTGAIDVLPLVPVAGITLAESAVLARGLAERMFRELGIPCFCYEAAAFRPERKNLAVCRIGEYEGLQARMADPDKRPDFCGGWDERAARSGASNVGARNFLIAVNFNLNTTSAEAATEIARDVREKGRKGPDGRWTPGPLKGCKAIGWYIEEYGIAQVSMNITDIAATPLHAAYEEVCRAAAARGLRVTGTEIIGLVPRCVLVGAGRHFLAKRGQPTDVPEADLVQVAVMSMGLDELKPFDPQRKVIEYLLEETI